MSVSTKTEWGTRVKELTDRFGSGREALLPILQEIQLQYGCVSLPAQMAVAEALNIPPVRVEEVVAFYAFLSEEPKGRYVVRLCQTITCDMAGKDAVAKALEEELGISFGQTTSDGLFTLEYTNCIGMCDQGPAMLVNDDVHTRLSPQKVREIIGEYRKK